MHIHCSYDVTQSKYPIDKAFRHCSYRGRNTLYNGARRTKNGTQPRNNTIAPSFCTMSLVQCSKPRYRMPISGAAWYRVRMRSAGAEHVVAKNAAMREPVRCNGTPSSIQPLRLKTVLQPS